MGTENSPPSPDLSPGTPASLGYRMPAEWEPHAATWLSWPHNEATWPGKLAAIPPIWVEMARALAPGEAVEILVPNARVAAQARRLLVGGGAMRANVRLHEVPTNDGAWMRDCGPTFVTRNNRGRAQTALVNWGYNAWGGKYPPWDEDDRVPERLAAILGLPVFAPGIVLEGGSIDVNGRGTLLTTESCLLNPNRNPHLSREQIEAFLRDYLGVRHILWLGEGIAGDDTDGHVDDLARFVDPTTVVTVATPDRRHPDHAALEENRRRLGEMTDQDGRPLRVLALPMPDPIEHEGHPLPASYANFYIGNGAVLVPTFRQPADEAALSLLRQVFPTRRVDGIDAVDLVWGLGAFHCVTQQQPGA